MRGAAAEMYSDSCDPQRPLDGAGDTDVTSLCHIVMTRVSEALGRA